jgi:sodium-dependent phosphate cotransporter
MRRVPINAAKNLGKATRVWKLFPLVYIAVAFFGIPLIALGVSMCFTHGSIGLLALGIILVIFLVLAILYFIFWWRRKDGANKCYMCFVRKEKKRVMMNSLPETLDQIQSDLGRMKEAIGMPDDMEEKNEEAQTLLSSDQTLDVTDVTENEGNSALKEETSEDDTMET